MGNSRTLHTRHRVRKHLPIILPISALYLYLVFFGIKKPRINFSDDRLSDSSSLIERSDWQNTGHPQHDFHVYSAYSFENGEKGSAIPEVVILTAYRNFQDESVKCQFYFEEDDQKNKIEKVSVMVPGHIETIPGWDERFAGNYIKCRIPVESDDINDIQDHPLKKPKSVSVLIGNQTKSASRLDIQYKNVPSEKVDDQDKTYPYQFSLCPMTPISDYNQVFHFLEWVEFYRMMGVQKFTFYNMSIGPELSCVMRHLPIYHAGITIDIGQWQEYPVQNFSITKYGHGSSVAANDCLMRHKGSSKYLLFAELDDYVMLSEERSMRRYDDLVTYLHDLNETAKYGEYVVRRAFFERKRESMGTSKADSCSAFRSNRFAFYACQALSLLQFDKRQSFLGPEVARRSTVYMVRPERVNTAGEHHVTKMGGDYDSKKVPDFLAVSKHLRKHEFEGKVVEDKMSQQMGIEIARNVVDSVEYFMDRCDLTLSDIFKEK